MEKYEEYDIIENGIIRKVKDSILLAESQIFSGMAKIEVLEITVQSSEYPLSWDENYPYNIRVKVLGVEDPEKIISQIMSKSDLMVERILQVGTTRVFEIDAWD